MCSSTWFLWFFLSLDCPVNTDKRGEKIRHVWRDGRSLSLIRVQPTKSTPKRSHWDEKVALRRNRSRSRRYQQQESSLLTRASSALHFSDADSIRVRARDSPLLVCFVMQSTTEERKFGRMNSWEKNQTRAHFSPKRTTKPEHIFAPPILWEGVEDLRRYTSECEITRTTGTNTLHEKVFSLFLFWTMTMPR